MSAREELQRLGRMVTLNRRKGDALAGRGDRDGAVIAYREAVRNADDGLSALGVPRLHAAAVPVVTIKAESAPDAAEWLGVRGGLLRRISEMDPTAPLDAALVSYRLGADIERAHDLPSTYNRTNVVRLELMTGRSTVAEQHAELTALRDALERRLATDERAADDAWLWADLGDVTLLLGDERAAWSAFRTFAVRGRSDSPATTLKVQHDLVEALETNGDPAAPEVAASLQSLKSMLS
jgi:hypothetical protein